MKFTLLISIFVFGFLFIFGAAVTTQAATFVVNNTGDSDGICNAACSLREAIKAAKATPSADTITFSIPANAPGCSNGVCTITPVNGNLTISGDGGALTITNAGGAQGVRVSKANIGGVFVGNVFSISSGASVTMNNLTITGGSIVSPRGAAVGAGIYSIGNLTLIKCTVTGNSASTDGDDVFGGGIYQFGGSLTITDSIISNNSISGGYGNRLGGGIYQFGGSLTITNSTISNNTATGDGGTPTDANSGGGLYVKTSGQVTIDRTAIFGNSANGGFSVHNNGGGVFIDAPSAKIINSTISNNSAIGRAQGAFNTENKGGGIHQAANSLEIINSTITANLTQNGTVNQGGGIFSNGTLTMTSSTISENSAVSGGGGFFIGAANLRNTIIANSVSGGDCSRENNSTVNAQYSLIEGTLGCLNGTNVNNRTGDPMLGPLQNNGGSTQTHALLPGSPAIDKGSSFGLTSDQRGFTRPIDNASISNATGGNGADIGAFEMQLAPTAATVSVSGRVTTASGRGILNVRLSLTDSSGQTRTATTTSFGYYHFDNVQAGETYILSAVGKRYTFSQPVQVLNINEETEEVNFIADSTKGVRGF